MFDDQDGCECVFLLVPVYPGRPGQKAVKRLCVSTITQADTVQYACTSYTVNNQWMEQNSVMHTANHCTCTSPVYLSKFNSDGSEFFVCIGCVKSLARKPAMTYTTKRSSA